jgi:hypothetical protein
MKLNYFKNFDEIVADFLKLSIEDQHKELALVQRNYEKQNAADFLYLGKQTAQTKLIKRLLDKLKDAHENNKKNNEA